MECALRLVTIFSVMRNLQKHEQLLPVPIECFLAELRLNLQRGCSWIIWVKSKRSPICSNTLLRELASLETWTSQLTGMSTNTGVFPHSDIIIVLTIIHNIIILKNVWTGIGVRCRVCNCGLLRRKNWDQHVAGIQHRGNVAGMAGVWQVHGIAFPTWMPAKS